MRRSCRILFFFFGQVPAGGEEKRRRNKRTKNKIDGRKKENDGSKTKKMLRTKLEDAVRGCLNVECKELVNSLKYKDDEIVRKRDGKIKHLTPAA